MQQARVAMGLSVRDAADATRLRADVIENMESGEFNFNLPEIYKRGFLRIYAAFLRLDAVGILEEYSDSARGSLDDSRRRNILSRMSAQAKPEYEAPAPASVESRFEESETPAHKDDSEDSSAKFIKLAAIFGGVFLAAAVLVLIISSLFKRPAVSDESADSQINANIATQPAYASAKAAAGELKLVISALNDTYVAVFPDGKENEVFYAGTLQAGEKKEFKSAVPIMVRVTDAERIRLERNSKPLDLKGAKGVRIFRIKAE